MLQRISSREVWIWGYLCVALAYVVILLGGLPSLLFGLKPLLVPLLGLYLWQAGRSWGDRRKQTLLLALFFSFLGDVFLLPWPKADFFLFGLGSFLVAQICYASVFWQWPKAKSLGRIADNLFWLFLFIGYLILLMVAFWPGIAPALRIPVFLYGLIITTMGAGAFNVSPLLPRPFGSYLLGGALLFILSDSLIGFQRFGLLDGNETLISLGIMLTYMAA